MTCTDAHKEFIVYLEKIKNRSPYTVRNYDHYLKRFVGFLGYIKLTEITVQQIDRFRVYLSSLNLDVSTQTYHLFAVKSLLQYYQRRGVACLSPKHIDI